MKSSTQTQRRTFALFAAILTALALSAPQAFAEEKNAGDHPEFSSRQEKRAYFEKLRAEDPDKFKEIMEKRFKKKWKDGCAHCDHVKKDMKIRHTSEQ